jgi:hypothetical protein
VTRLCGHDQLLNEMQILMTQGLEEKGREDYGSEGLGKCKLAGRTAGIYSFQAAVASSPGLLRGGSKK